MKYATYQMKTQSDPEAHPALLYNGFFSGKKVAAA
jgi:hypothetical protein